MILTLYLTLSCNQNCRYCYAIPHRNADMPIDVAKKSIEITARHLKNIGDNNLGIRFFGGEPLLVWYMIPNLVEFTRAIGKKYKLNLSFAIATNGTLLTEDHCKFFTKHDFAVGISIDGPEEVHDRNRKWIDGTSSYSVVMEKIRLAARSDLRMELVLVSDPTTVSDLSKSVRYLHRESGAYFFTLSFNIHVHWSEKDLLELERSYSELGDLYVECFNNSKPIQIDFLNNKLNVILRGGYRREFICDIGKTDLAVTPEGNFYPCLRLAAMDTKGATIIGDVAGGLSSELISNLKSAVDKRFNKKHLPKDCQACFNSDNCLNWCAAANLAMTGNPARVGDLMCSHERLSIRLAEKIINKFDIDLYKKLYSEYFQFSPRQYISPAIPHSELGLQFKIN
jgi:uncharacterized protein